ncbi:restriction endonuclease subunit S [Streptococcus suis]|uniref:restriction endonuclease subunit S n=1 Tax=Streptococcus suis TaxID=1307 RepID=UPI0025AF6EB2|nr:restriction endonuclease subunit S [Streptococcus suis]MDN2968805.1 restriction endonuclease subunit S [Streptococcus suis]MDN2976560.1 restriction endonuclease subunit S [Streptococcus suis]MDS1161841.1 restriction endonuclease subunit S [Streptococcus suis]HEL1704979.1 restriction endonuclease subunit S [Streptococcus suis]HEL2080350.1 restriction endonuclease subunit S [Streptococcus suis]
MSEWKKYKLSEIYTMSSGISSSKSQAGQGSPFLSFSTVFNNYFIPENLKDLMLTTKEEQERFSIIEGDVFLTRTSETLDELALSSVALNNYPFATYSGFLKRLRPKNKIKVYPKFIAFYLRSSYFRKTIINHTTMTLRASFNESMFSYLEVYLPDYDEQVRIGDFLYKVNQKITLNNQINEELEAMAKTLYDYWFVQFDFPDENGKPYKSSGGKMVYNDQLKREIPEGWGVKQLGEICEFRNGINYEKSETGDTLSKIVNVRNISNSSTFVTTYDLDSITLDRRRIESYLVTDRTILITRSGIPGATRIVSDIPANTIYSGFIIGATVANLNLFYYVFYHLKNIEMLMSNQSAGTIMKNISQTTLSEICIAIPNKEIQKMFSKQVRSLLDVIENNIKQNQELTQLRDWLLPMLMNGQVRVE